MSSKKGPVPPVAWKNSFFWFAIILFGLGVFGLIRGEAVIRDPGQIKEGGLVFYYFGGAIVMAVNGVITHLLAAKAYEDDKEASSS